MLKLILNKSPLKPKQTKLVLAVLLSALIIMPIRYFNHDPDHIYHTAYLDKIYNTKKNVFIVNDGLFYQASCAKIETWVSQHLKPDGLDLEREIKFLRHSEEINEDYPIRAGELKMTETVDKNHGRIETRRYYLSSLTDLDIISQYIRQHWAIENSQHWVLDVCFN